jgi:cytochrome P450
MWVLSRYADIVSAGQDWQTYSSASGNLMTELPGRAGATLGSSDPPKHDRLRGLIQHAFMKRNLLALEEPIRAVAKDVFAQLKNGARQFDFKEVSSQVHGEGADGRAGPAHGRRSHRRRSRWCATTPC